MEFWFGARFKCGSWEVFRYLSVSHCRKIGCLLLRRFLTLPVEVAVAGYHTHETPKMTKDKTKNNRLNTPAVAVQHGHNDANLTNTETCVCLIQ